MGELGLNFIIWDIIKKYFKMNPGVTMSQNKSVSVTVPKALAERLSLIRCFSRRCDTVSKATLDAMYALVSELEDALSIDKDTWKTAKRCPSCSTGMLIKRRRKNLPDSQPFYGCVNFPDCKHKEKFNHESK